MAEFLTTSGTSFYIEKIILESSRKLVLVSPYLKLSKILYERLKDSSIRGTRITIIYGKDELKPNEYNSLAELKNVSLYYFDNLHAKCYFNESMMVITSMNMYEFSEKTNREMGVLIDCVKDKELFEKAKMETESIIQSADFEQLKKQDRRSNAPAQGNNPASKNSGVRGYCIRCETRIKLDPAKPYCADCYSIWANYSNPEYIETVCHQCGQFEKTSMAKPRCYTCFSNF
jgi:phosphatidylserine/phosphatidylglycerophosphate/cardiolipin synthase-like enzyme